MTIAAGELEFEEAARIRDEVRRLEATELGLHKGGVAIGAAAKAGWTPQYKHKKRVKNKRMKRA